MQARSDFTSVEPISTRSRPPTRLWTVNESTATRKIALTELASGSAKYPSEVRISAQVIRKNRAVVAVPSNVGTKDC